MKNIIREFMDMKPGAGFLRNIERIARALELIAAHLITISNTLETGSRDLNAMTELLIAFEERITGAEMMPISTDDKLTGYKQ